MSDNQGFPQPNEGKYRNIIQEFMVERTRRPAGFSMGGPHYHPYYELYYLVTGRCRMFIQYKLYYVSAGDMVFLPPSCLHRTTYGQGQAVDRFTANFTPGFVRAFTESCTGGALPSAFPHQKLTIPEGSRSEVEQLFSSMIRESLQEDPFTQIQKKSLLFQLLALLGRCQQAIPSPQLLVPDDEAIQQAAQFIYRHHREPVSLEQAARAGHLSPTYFSRRFRQVTGMRFKEYLTHVRLLDAAELLRATGRPVTEIAVTCGFSDGNYFGDAFKKAYGMPPSQFRKNRGPI